MMTDDEITDALWKLGGYSPEGVAVQETIATLREKLAAERAKREEAETEAAGWNNAASQQAAAAQVERDARLAAEARAERLDLDIAFLLPRAYGANSCRLYGPERDTGSSSNNLVNVAYGGEDDHARPYDKSDLRACELAYERMPAHRKTEAVNALLAEMREAVERESRP